MGKELGEHIALREIISLNNLEIKKIFSKTDHTKKVPKIMKK